MSAGCSVVEMEGALCVGAVAAVLCTSVRTALAILI
jgi:hypothetical protein